MPSVLSLKKIPVYVWIPPTFAPIYKIELVKGTSGTTYDITDIIYEGNYTDGITQTIGNFEFTVDNTNETYTGVFALYDTIKISIDYGTDATTIRFKGMIEKVSQRGEKLIVSGRSVAARVMGITVTKSYTNQYTHDIIIDLLSSYASYITTTNVDTVDITDTQVTVNWYQRPFWECILELCSRATYDFYIDTNFDANYFVSNTRQNANECVVHEYNLIETGDFAPDLSVLKNRIIVYGNKVEDQQIIYTAEDTDSITAYDLKEEIINDTSLVTVSQAEARADYELASKKDPPIIGEVTSLILPTITPGEQIRISDPMSNLQPAYYAIQKYTHSFSNDEPPQTTLTVQKEINTVYTILKKRITFETQAVSMDNPNEMKYSIIDDFSVDLGTHTNTAIANGRLYATSGGGYWVSEVTNAETDATTAEFRVKGDQLVAGMQYFVSTNNGLFYQSITPNTAITLTPPGRVIKVKVLFNITTPQIDSYSLLYK
jgi:hypothetical protein